MTPSGIQREIDRLRLAVAELEADRQRWRHTLDVAYTAEPFNQADVNSARQAITHLDREHSELSDRIGVLTSKLPTPEDVARATASANRLLAQGQNAEARYHASWSGFIAKLEEVEISARLLDADRTEVTTAIAQLADLIRNYGIKVDVPRLPAPTSRDMTVATHIALVLQDIAQGCAPSATVELYLADARRQHVAVVA